MGRHKQRDGSVDSAGRDARALPVPVRSDDALIQLRALLNVAPGEAGDADFRLLVAWLVTALYPSGPYTVLALDGEQGSGKSTVSRILRKLIDPNKAEHHAPPRTEDDLVIAAQNSRVVALDNVSHIDPEMADAICRLATGAGLSKRRLYTDGEEHLAAPSRPVLLNGIPSLLGRGDLADRSLAITLPPIPDKQRRPESEIWATFDRAAPGILALLLDGLATALRNLPTLVLPHLPRMADFARVACAAAPAFGWTADEMLAAIEANKEAAISTVIESDPIAGAVRELLGEDQSSEWKGTATELLAAVNNKVASEITRERGWPRDAARLSARLRRLAPALRRGGVNVILPTAGGRGGRIITIKPERSADPGADAWETAL